MYSFILKIRIQCCFVLSSGLAPGNRHKVEKTSFLSSRGLPADDRLLYRKACYASQTWGISRSKEKDSDRGGKNVLIEKKKTH